MAGGPGGAGGTVGGRGGGVVRMRGTEPRWGAAPGGTDGAAAPWLAPALAGAGAAEARLTFGFTVEAGAGALRGEGAREPERAGRVIVCKRASGVATISNGRSSMS